MQTQFEVYLTQRGYTVTTPSGNPSTVYAYTKTVSKVCEWENTTWEGLADNIARIVAIYDVGGEKEEYGRKSHNAVISALKRFQEFLAARR